MADVSEFAGMDYDILEMPLTPTIPDPPPPKAKIVLNPDGREILRDFFASVTDVPSSAQKNTLLFKIIAAGNPEYNYDRVNAWFINQRKVARKKAQKANTSNATASQPPATSTPLASKFTPMTESFLNDLYTHTPNVTDELIVTWAGILKVQLPVVQAWINVQREASRKGRNLLTPPGEDEDQSRKRRKMDGDAQPLPVALKKIRLIVSPQGASAGELDQEEAMAKTKKPSHRERLIGAILTGMDAAESAATETGTSTQLTPMSRDAFSDAFGPYETKMAEFLGKVGRGEFEQKGWKPDMAPPEYRPSSS